MAEQKIVQLSPSEITIDEDGNVVISNPAAAEVITAAIAEFGTEESENVALIHNGGGCACVG